MFKTENHCKTPHVVNATDGIQHTRKRGLRNLKRTLKEGGLIFGVLRYGKDNNVGAEYMIFRIETLFNQIHF